jgi:hypothetical protein
VACLLLGWRCASHPSRKVRGEDGSPAVFTAPKGWLSVQGLKAGSLAGLSARAEALAYLEATAYLRG